ncbi:MAG: NAD-dependent epimerase/dehydratase family protein [Candidatus Thorarchaeota archaeon]
MESGTVVITGGAGFIGSHLVDYFIGKNFEVLVIDNLAQGKKENVNNDATLLTKDVRKIDKTDFDGFDPIILVHLAAFLGVEAATKNPLETMDVEFFGTKKILEEIPNKRLETVFFSSTSEVYGESPIKGSCETDIPVPHSPYAISKLLAENWITNYCVKYELENVVIARYFNTYGERQDERFVVPRFIRNAIGNKPLLIHGDGLQTRSFLNIEDATKIASCLIENVRGSEIFNIGNNNPMTMKELANKVKQILNSDSPIVHQSYQQAERDSVYNIIYRNPMIDKMLSVMKKIEFIPIEKGIQSLGEVMGSN